MPSKLLRGWLARVAAKRPAREYVAEVIDERGEILTDSNGDPIRAPLFRRYFLFRLWGRTYYLHHYLRSDPDRGPHCHPWRRAIAVPLAGGYIEERLSGFTSHGMLLRRRRRRPGRPYRLCQGDFHRVLIEEDKTSWSLFAHTPEVCGWGFLRQTGEVGVVRYDAFKASATPEDSWWLEAPRGRELARISP